VPVKKLSLKQCEIKKGAEKQAFSKKVEKITRKGFFVMPDFDDNGKKRLFFGQIFTNYLQSVPVML
jgi:hypothetical protein